jgi:hypothetical protein
MRYNSKQKSTAAIRHDHLDKQILVVTGHHDFNSGSGKFEIESTSEKVENTKFMKVTHMFIKYHMKYEPFTKKRQRRLLRA